MSALWNFSLFILTLGILITVHEFCHFWVARRNGVKVERFSIGFGKPLWKYTDVQGTEYILALIPLGGYVKMLDERAGPVAPSMLEQTFNSKTYWQRTMIIGAGPVGNIVFAFFILWIVFLLGIPGLRPIVNQVLPASAAEKAGIVSGEEVKAIDGVITPDWDTVRLSLLSKLGQKKAELTVVDNANKTILRILDLTEWQFQPNQQDPLVTLGIVPWIVQVEPILSKVLPASAAEKAGLQVNDKIIAVNGKSINNWLVFTEKIAESPGISLQVQVQRQGKDFFLSLTPESKLIGDKVQGIVGIAPKIMPLPDRYRVDNKYGFFAAADKAFERTMQLIYLTYKMLVKLILGSIGINNLSGPLAIAQGAGASAAQGATYYLMFLALISINLGVLNLLPIPVLDGGQLLFLFLEKIKGSPLSENIQDISYRIGALLLMLLMGLALFNDFSRI